ncbi:MAG TPA: hypothetical protein VKT32_00865 [Chthonomonadaceae bacterium]|nr:hypothetical protein [Chthonomonadaceae bacterium]
MFHRLLYGLMIAGALGIGLMGFSPARAQEGPFTSHPGRGAHAKRAQDSPWGTPPRTRQANRRNSLWGGGVQPLSPWGEKRKGRGLNSSPPSPWTASNRRYAGGKGRQHTPGYESRPAHAGGRAAPHPRNAFRGERRTERVTLGTGKPKTAHPAGPHKKDSQAPDQTGLPQK